MTTVSLEPRRERKKRETRRRIVEATTRLLEQRAFAELTVDEIAAAADVAKGTIYNYFDTKEAILFEFLLTLEERVQAELGRFAAAPGPLSSILQEWLRWQLELKAPHLPAVRVFLSQLVLRAADLEEHIERVQRYVDPPLMGLLRALGERGLIPPGSDAERIARELKVLHFGLSCMWATEGPPFANTYAALATQVSAFCGALERGEL